MMEMKITVEAPDLAASILKLAKAIASGPDPDILTPDEPLPVASYGRTPPFDTQHTRQSIKKENKDYVSE